MTKAKPEIDLSDLDEPEKPAAPKTKKQPKTADAAPESEAIMLKMMDRMEQMERRIKSLGEENAGLKSQVNAATNGDWPAHAEVQRQAALIREKSVIKREGDHLYQITVAPHKKKGNDGKPVVYKQLLKFRSNVKPEKKKGELSGVVKSMVLAEYCASRGVKIPLESARVEVLSG